MKERDVKLRARAGRTSKQNDTSSLFMLVGREYEKWIKEGLKKDVRIGAYTFMWIFEDHVQCGDSGAFNWIFEIHFSQKKTADQLVGVKANLLITLEEYDEYRLRRKARKGRDRNPYAFPEYEKMED